jgi:5-epi-alpha-selinene synthase
MNAPLPSPGFSRKARVSLVGSVLDFDPVEGLPGRPKLECGLRSAINEHLERACRHTLGWAVDLGLVEAEGRAFERFCKARFTWLAARAYPSVEAEQLELISDWITFLFFYDDMCDTQEATDPDYLDKLMVAEQRLIEIGFGAPAQAEDTPLDLALVDIRERAAAIAGPGWLERLGGHIREYIEGVRWERVIRLQRQVPSLATYSRLRLLISAVFPCFDFAGMCIDGGQTDFANNVLVEQLEVMATNYICWVNDIYGVDKEIAEDTTSNIVIVLAHEFDLDWDAALDRAIEMCNSELDAFINLERQLSLLAEPSCRAYVDALRSWMRGNLDWYAETKRYATTGQCSPAACWSPWTSWQSVA